jgi:hypothetical protein
MTGEQLGISGFKAKKEDHDEIERGFRALLDFEQTHSDLWHYSSTRYYTRDVPGSSDEEYWMFIDRFEDYEDYIASLTNAASSPEAKEAQALLLGVFSHARGFLTGAGDPFASGLGSMMQLIEHWVEVPSLRVDDLGH